MARPALVRFAAALAAAGLAVPGAGCAANDGRGNGSARTITVFAAASLADAFEALADAFEVAHPGTSVRLNIAGSSELAAQVADGAPADVLATADGASMAAALDGGQAAGAASLAPAVFATNQMQIVVGAGNPLGIEVVADLAEPGLLVVLCAVEVPCGAYAESVLEQAGVQLKPVSLERNVKGVVSKVSLGEADAGIVYQTDVRAAGEVVSGVDIPTGLNVAVEYPIVALTDGDAVAFVEFVLGPEGRSILGTYGFGIP